MTACYVLFLLVFLGLQAWLSPLGAGSRRNAWKQKRLFCGCGAGYVALGLRRCCFGLASLGLPADRWKFHPSPCHRRRFPAIVRLSRLAIRATAPRGCVEAGFVMCGSLMTRANVMPWRSSLRAPTRRLSLVIHTLYRRGGHFLTRP